MSMTIGEVLTALKRAKPDVYVMFGFGGVCPTTVGSWRGIYAEAAIGFTSGEYGHDGCTVEQLTNELTKAITPGVTYSGWKGGEYQYTEDTPLHVDNRGECTNTEIARIQVDEYIVVIHTEYEP